jgi:hypothetical protein
VSGASPVRVLYRRISVVIRNKIVAVPPAQSVLFRLVENLHRQLLLLVDLQFPARQNVNRKNQIVQVTVLSRADFQ